jgi:oligopeptide transport system ATP-binding protein
MTPLLRMKNVRTNLFSHKKKIHAVRNVSFDLGEGEVLGVVGESGSGKSIMAKTIMQLLPRFTSEVISGSILYKEEDLLQKSEKNLRSIRGKEISMIFQDPMTSLNPTMKIGKQIGEGYKLHHPHATKEVVYTEVIKLLNQVGIPQAEARYSQYPHELSGGMRQRVMIAIAIIAKPRILIADEPTTALDVTIQAQILELLKEIQKKEQMSILFITHDFSIISSFCDRVLVMYAGEIIEVATVEQLFTAPKHPYTQSLFAAIPRLDTPIGKALHTIQGSPLHVTSKIRGCSFQNRCPYGKEICRKKRAPSFEVSPDHHTNCWLYERGE